MGRAFIAVGMLILTACAQGTGGGGASTPSGPVLAPTAAPAAVETAALPPPSAADAALMQAIASGLGYPKIGTVYLEYVFAGQKTYADASQVSDNIQRISDAWMLRF